MPLLNHYVYENDSFNRNTGFKERNLILTFSLRLNISLRLKYYHEKDNNFALFNWNCRIFHVATNFQDASFHVSGIQTLEKQ